MRHLFLALALLTTAVSAADTALLHKGQALAAARAHLLAQGWQPRATRLSLADGQAENRSGSAKTFYRAGYREVEVCSGTGANFCIFNYLRDGACMRVVTVGELPRDASVASWADECPPEDAR
ncbi:hypothetical protein GCM10025771_21730 [Niveibacterium umoris]|uniref:Beta/gamma crystallin 'Greek key' domain-containing protein n=1 Tax=Niveibacterium umoris TaxID=1193620 RepID=A0A840BQE1_9RHOO|nr:hypothetical protein [Niveibacterium umoris]MBB4012637.1 hypothetical protein [Niveibacterium umoris]